LRHVIVRELWSDREEADLARFLGAASAGNLVAALHAIESASEEDAAADRALLAAWARRVEERLPRRGYVRPAEEARVLAVVLGHEAGFAGNRDDYYDPRNSFLHQVVASRRGLPILLSAIWIEVGQRAGSLVAGIGLPGHFVVRVGARESVLADPFAGGRLLTVDDCRRRVEELSGGSMPWRAEYLRETSTEQVLERVLANLAGAYKRADDEAGRYRVAAFLASLRPDSAQRLFERAELAEELGIREIAEKDYTDLVERFPDSTEAQQAAERLDGDTEIPSPN
jgi:regulator of sirC expression with transglutaminase-like and TPR domain